MQFFRQGHLTMVVLLLGFGADPTLRDGQGEFMMVISIYFMSSNFHDHLIVLFHIEKMKLQKLYWDFLETFQIANNDCCNLKNITHLPHFCKLCFKIKGEKMDIWYYVFFYNGIRVACQQHFFFFFAINKFHSLLFLIKAHNNI